MGLLSTHDAVEAGVINLLNPEGEASSTIRRAASQPGVSASGSINLNSFTARRTRSETNELSAQNMSSLLDGTGVTLQSVFDPAAGLRLYSMHANTGHLVDRRSSAQQVMCKTVVQVLESVPPSDKHYSQFKNLAVDLRQQLEDNPREACIYGDEVHALDTLLSMSFDNINIGNNALARILQITEDKHHVDDFSNFAHVMVALTLSDDEVPAAAFARAKPVISEFERHSLNSDIDFDAFGFRMSDGKNGKMFSALTDNKVACILMLQFCKRLDLIPGIRQVMTDEVIASIFAGKFTHADFEQINAVFIDRQFSLVTEPSPATHKKSMQTAAFGSFSGKGSGHGGASSVNFEATKGKGKGGKGKGGKSGKGGSSNHSSVGGKGAGGGGGGVGGKGSSRPLPPKRKVSTVSPGDITGAQYYERIVKLVGPNYENVQHIANIVNKYFKDTIGQQPFTTTSGNVIIPIALTRSFAWKPVPAQDLNWNCRRDVYAAWQVLNDFFNFNREYGLTTLGREYAAKVTDWAPFTRAEWNELNWTPTSGPAPVMKQVQIRGEKFTELTA